MITVEESYRRVEQIARQRARNFYYSFLLLPREKRLAMCAIYAFMRECDDISDADGAGSAEARKAALERWRNDLDSTFAGSPAESPIWPAFGDAVKRFGIPKRYFHEMIDGVESDLEARKIENFEDLYRYCYQVASVVGLTITHIFGFESEKALELAEKCGVAFQLTNILRDVREDSGNGRVYLPEDEMRSHGVSDATRPSPELKRLLESLAERAAAYYRESQPLPGMVHKDSQASLWALMEIYRRLLEKIERFEYDVFSRRVRLSAFEKSGIVARAWLGLTS
jgi:15-cis-phytoene synthase